MKTSHGLKKIFEFRIGYYILRAADWEKSNSRHLPHRSVECWCASVNRNSIFHLYWFAQLNWISFFNLFLAHAKPFHSLNLNWFEFIPTFPKLSLFCLSLILAIGAGNSFGSQRSPESRVFIVFYFFIFVNVFVISARNLWI